MNVGITGVSGFIGSRVAAQCGTRGIQVIGFSRNPGSGARRFDLTSVPDISGLDAIINLAGEPILGRLDEGKEATYSREPRSWNTAPRRGYREGAAGRLVCW